MKTYVKIVCLLVVGAALMLGNCTKKKSTEPGNGTPTDTQKPSVSITTPTSETGYATDQQTLDLSGEASDDEGVASVIWSNVSTGASGNCTGTTSWSATGVTLQEEDNLIVVTASDAAGNTGSDSLTVTYNQYVSFTTDPTTDPSGVIMAQSTDVTILIGIAPNPNLMDSSVRLLRVDSQGNVTDSLNFLYDDGDLSHADDIAGDGIFSTKQNFLESFEGTIRLRIRVITQESGGDVIAYTSIFTIPVVAAITSQEFEDALDAQNLGSDKYDSLLALVGEDEAKQQTLAWIKAQSGVDSAGLTDEGDAIWVEYHSGISGMILLYGEDIKGGSSERIREKQTKLPLSSQTRGTVDLSQTGRFAHFMAVDDTVGSTNVLIYDAFHTQFPTEGNEIESIFVKSECPKFTVTHAKNTQCTVDMVETFSLYGTIYISTHGSVRNGQVRFLTGELAAGFDLLRFIDLSLKRLGLGTVKGKTYYTIYPSFITSYTGKYPKSIVFNSSCYSSANQTMSNAFKNKGALTYLGFDNSVGGTFARTSGTGFFKKMVNDKKKSGEAFTAGQKDPGHKHAEFKMSGSNKAIYQSDFFNGGFETGNLQGWIKDGDGRVITKLVFLTPQEGSFMGIISTGLGYTTQSGSIFQSFCIPEGETTLSFKYNFLSEEFMEYVGSEFQDYFTVIIKTETDSTTLLYLYIDGLQNEVQAVPNINFDVGDVYMTGWQTASLNISAYAGKSVTIIFKCGDVGDSIYDTVILLDDIKFE